MSDNIPVNAWKFKSSFCEDWLYGQTRRELEVPVVGMGTLGNENIPGPSNSTASLTLALQTQQRTSVTAGHLDTYISRTQAQQDLMSDSDRPDIHWQSGRINPLGTASEYLNNTGQSEIFSLPPSTSLHTSKEASLISAFNIDHDLTHQSHFNHKVGSSAQPVNLQLLLYGSKDSAIFCVHNPAANIIVGSVDLTAFLADLKTVHYEEFRKAQAMSKGKAPLVIDVEGSSYY